MSFLCLLLSLLCPNLPLRASLLSRPRIVQLQPRHVGPTRASIRAWAKATPAGAPRDTPSPHTSALNSSGSDDSGSRVSLTRSASHIVGLPHIQRSGEPSSGSRFEDPSLSKMARQAETEESSGNIADGESSGSEPASTPGPSPITFINLIRTLTCTLTPKLTHNLIRIRTRRLRLILAPILTPIRTSHSTILTLRRTPTAARHLPRASPRPNTSPLIAKSSKTAETAARTDTRPAAGADIATASVTATEIETGTDVRLQPHPSSTPIRTPRAPAGDMDVLDEITKMLALSSTPLLRRGGGVDVGMGGDGWVPLRVPRENDVLDDIYKMIMWSRGV
ncbi:hypothetical protein GY45DRAFT_1339359 [Cubamyces sp. BRFM 1775]|nr:hypothetical protein GY45DRAFT_1339359 [Cubamyces sp. BRFM 1775]